VDYIIIVVDMDGVFLMVMEDVDTVLEDVDTDMEVVDTDMEVVDTDLEDVVIMDGTIVV
jgi:hypothetical protein